MQAGGFDFPVQVQVVGAGFSYRDAVAWAIHVSVGFDGRPVAYQIGAFNDDVRRRLQHVCAAGRVNPDEGDVDLSGFDRFYHFTGSVKKHQFYR